ncbi:hypothetical protein EP7_000300 [Isosphaeraceae bacterium EP7]
MFQLPPGFKTVDLPLEKRKEVFREAHGIRALAVQEANLELPMDEASMPVNDSAAFDKRMADHRAIIERVLGKNLAALAEKYQISVPDVEKIEEEARRLRWPPPQEPVLEAEPQGADRKVQPEDGTTVEKKDVPQPGKNGAK